jgi:hypothetical protein
LAGPWQDSLAAAKRAFTPNCARNRYLLSRKRDSRTPETDGKSLSINALDTRVPLARPLQKACGPAGPLVGEGCSSR